MQDLRSVLEEAWKEGRAIGHFNTTDTVTLRAIFEAARELNLPVIVGTSEGERDFIGVRQIVALVHSLREQYDFPIFLNADHTHSFDKIKEAVGAGYDAVLFDGGKLSLDENISETKKVVDYVRTHRPGVIVEGELGYIGSGSQILDSLPEGVGFRPEDLTSSEDAMRFVRETGVDLIAPAVGNLHGILAGGKNPRLDLERIRQIVEVVSAGVVLHGGSGMSDEDFVGAVKSGVRIIHINTELRVAWRKGLEMGLQDPKEVVPSKILSHSLQGVREVVLRRLSLFSRRGWL